jgi:phosphoribosylformylglycinamidine synthase
MYVDGHLPGRYGETHKISALETLQFSAVSVINDINKCITMDSKIPGDLIYVLGTTRNELGASEYYEHLGYIGLNVPKVFPDQFMKIYMALGDAIDRGLVASAHGVYRGGLGIHLAMVAMGGDLGMKVDVGLVPAEGAGRGDVILFSESAGRIIASIAPENKNEFENLFSGLPFACVGTVTGNKNFVVDGPQGRNLVSVSVEELRNAWKKPLGELI